MKKLSKTAIIKSFTPGFKRLNAQIRMWREDNDTEMLGVVRADKKHVRGILNAFKESGNTDQLIKDMWRLDTIVRDDFFEVFDLLDNAATLV